MKDSAKDCCLCGQIKGDSERDLLHDLFGGSYSRRVPIETGDFAVIPSVGPLTRGHVLLVPKKHCKSLAAMDDGLDIQFEQFYSRLVDKLSQVYSCPVHAFEHGMSEQGSRIVCSTDHAHFHLVPTSVSVLPKIKSMFSWHEINYDLNSVRQHCKDGEYLLYRSPDGKQLITTAGSSPIVSQVLRRVFAEALCKPHHWNWKEHPDLPAVNDTFVDLS